MRLLHSHYGITKESKVKVKTLTKLLTDAVIKDAEDKLWQQWLVERPYMDEFVSFEDYKKKAMEKSKPKTTMDAKKIIEEAEEIKKLDQERG